MRTRKVSFLSHDVPLSRVPVHGAWAVGEKGAVARLFPVYARNRRDVMIGDVWVSPELRGRGTGRRLLVAALRTARRRGFSRAILWTTRDNTTATTLYKSLGFHRRPMPKRIQREIASLSWVKSPVFYSKKIQ